MHIGGRGRSQPPTDPYGPLDPRPIAKLEGERFGVANVVIEAVDGPLDTSHNSPAGRAETSAVTQPASESQSASQLPITTTIPTNGYTSLILDMGRIVGGFVEFSLSAPEGYLRFQRMTLGGLVPDWDVENAIVIAEPFMSYVVHDAVAQAGMADRLPDLCKRWAEFLVDGYDTLGENWGTGTHVHGWSSTPAKDLVFYTLGVTPAEPGYTVARIAPRLGGLQWAKGSVPTPHGLIHVEVSSDQLTVDSPVPVTIAMPQDIPTYMVAGKYTFSLTETKQLVL